uniref:Uncharacterized protein n=1 Tax=Panagrolaimus sp. JU765 TaxID=591449 RepID=A0AC34QB40_9BILA
MKQLSKFKVKCSTNKIEEIPENVDVEMQELGNPQQSAIEITENDVGDSEVENDEESQYGTFKDFLCHLCNRHAAQPLPVIDDRRRIPLVRPRQHFCFYINSYLLASISMTLSALILFYSVWLAMKYRREFLLEEFPTNTTFEGELIWEVKELEAVTRELDKIKRF